MFHSSCVSQLSFLNSQGLASCRGEATYHHPRAEETWATPLQATGEAPRLVSSRSSTAAMVAPWCPSVSTAATQAMSCNPATQTL